MFEKGKGGVPGGPRPAEETERPLKGVVLPYTSGSLETFVGLRRLARPAPVDTLWNRGSGDLRDLRDLVNRPVSRFRKEEDSH